MTSKRTAFALAAVLSGCSSGPTSEIEVSHFRVPCLQTEGPALCPLVKTLADLRPTTFYGELDFTPAWGTDYTLVVSDQTGTYDDDPVYRLREVVRETQVTPGTRFHYPFDADVLGREPMPSLDDQGGTLMDGKAFLCPDADTCRALAEAAHSGAKVDATFAFGDPIDGPLELVDFEHFDD